MPAIAFLDACEPSSIAQAAAPINHSAKPAGSFAASLASWILPCAVPTPGPAHPRGPLSAVITALLASDRAATLADRARGRDPRRLREAAERCEDVRQALELNVSEDLALSALGLRLAGLAGSPG